MSTETATDTQLTTATYAAVLGGDELSSTVDSHPTEKPSPADTTPQQGAPNSTTPTGKRSSTKSPPTEATDEDSGNTTGPLRSLGTAGNWMPRDFASVAPSATVDAVAKHRERVQNIDNFGVKVLYGLYVTAAVPVGFSLNLLSLIAAHAATALNEPERGKEAALGLVFLVIIVGGLLAFLGEW